MNVSALIPAPSHVRGFEWNAVRHVPERSGCYVLATFLRVVLYVGRTKNLRARMRQHLDDDRKLGATERGRAVFFCGWRPTTISELSAPGRMCTSNTRDACQS